MYLGNHFVVLQPPMNSILGQSLLSFGQGKNCLRVIQESTSIEKTYSREVNTTIISKIGIQLLLCNRIHILIESLAYNVFFQIALKLTETTNRRKRCI